MNKNTLRSAFAALLALYFAACSPQTSLIRTDSEYRPVQPRQTRLIADFDLSRLSAEPVIPVVISEERLSNKVLTHHYLRKYPSKKAWEVAGGLALGGAAAGLFIASGKTAPQDTTARVLYVIGGIAAGIGGLYLMLKPTPSNEFTRQEVRKQDTIFAFKSPLKSETISIQATHNNKTKMMTTGMMGQVKIDVREVSQDISDRDLLLNITYADARPATITVSADYMKTVLGNEREADALLKRADNSVTRKRFLDASELYRTIIETYPRTYAAATARANLDRYAEDIRQEKLLEVRRKLRSVTLSRVSTAVDRAGITTAELQDLGWRLDNAASPTRILINGFDMPLEERRAGDEYRALDNAQKIYALLAASERISTVERQEKDAVLARLVGVSESLAKKLARINSETLLEK